MLDIKVTPAKIEDTAGLQSWVVEQSPLEVPGEFIIYGRQFTIYPRDNTRMAIFSYMNPLPGCFLVQGMKGGLLRLECGAETKIFPLAAGIQPTGLASVGDRPRVACSASRGMVGYPEVIADCAATAEHKTRLWNYPVIGRPSTLLGRGLKTGLVAAAAGFNNLVPAITAGPIYALVSVKLACGDGTSLPPTPIYFAWRAGGLAAPVGAGFVMGDLTPLSGSEPIAFLVDEQVTDVGIWLPTIEEVTPVAEFAVINIGVWRLCAPRRIAMNSAAGQLPPNLIAPSVPGRNFIDSEVHFGA